MSIGVCTRRISTACRHRNGMFYSSEEDTNDPGDDLRGPECPDCYRQRKGLPPLARDHTQAEHDEMLADCREWRRPQ